MSFGERHRPSVAALRHARLMANRLLPPGAHAAVPCQCCSRAHAAHRRRVQRLRLGTTDDAPKQGSAAAPHARQRAFSVAPCPRASAAAWMGSAQNLARRFDQVGSMGGPSALGEVIRRVTVHVASRFSSTLRARRATEELSPAPPSASAARASHEHQLPGTIFLSHPPSSLASGRISGSF